MGWRQAWNNSLFRINVYLGLSILILISLFMPIFFSFIERRAGIVLADRLLELIPALDVSILIFTLLYGTIIWAVIQLAQHPVTCVKVLWSYIFLCLIRIVTISLVPLNPPVGLVDMWDPLSVLFYHSKAITKDLFFSGHTSTLCLAVLFLEGKQQRIIGFAIVALMGILLLIQHIHYSMDVLAAPLFSILCWYFGTAMCRNLHIVPYKIFAKESIS